MNFLRTSDKKLQHALAKAVVKVIVNGVFKGTGFFITPNGEVLTAYHCIGVGATEIVLLTYSGERLLARLEVEKSLPRYDLAVLKVDTSPVQCLPLGVVSSLAVTDNVLGLGYPAGDRADNQQLGCYPGTIFKFREDGKIETDAVRGEGQSGGPVYHYASQRVVGVVSQGYLPERVVFAGLAARLEPLFAGWQELSKITAEVARAWDKKMQWSNKQRWIIAITSALVVMMALFALFFSHQGDIHQTVGTEGVGVINTGTGSVTITNPHQ